MPTRINFVGSSRASTYWYASTIYLRIRGTFSSVQIDEREEREGEFATFDDTYQVAGNRRAVGMLNPNGMRDKNADTCQGGEGTTPAISWSGSRSSY